MQINILTLFPDFFKSPFESSMLKKAQERVDLEIKIINLRDFAQDKHHLTDEPPYGGGAGMVMKIEPIDLALESINVKKGQPNSKIILTSAKGRQFDHSTASGYSKLTEITIICGHYEGVDERVAEYLVDEEVRIGNYVLTGGEPAALVISDALIRLIPDTLGNSESLQEETHRETGITSYPQYTRPAVYQDWEVPNVLLSGDHQKINKWRAQQKKSLS